MSDIEEDVDVYVTAGTPRSPVEEATNRGVRHAEMIAKKMTPGDEARLQAHLMGLQTAQEAYPVLFKAPGGKEERGVGVPLHPRVTQPRDVPQPSAGGVIPPPAPRVDLGPASSSSQAVAQPYRQTPSSAPTVIADAARDLAGQVPPAGNDQQQAQPGLFQRIVSGTTGLLRSVAGSGAISTAGTYAGGAGGYLLGRTIEGVANQVLSGSGAVDVNKATQIASQVVKEAVPKMVKGSTPVSSPAYAQGAPISININTGSIGNKSEGSYERPTRLHPGSIAPHISYTHTPTVTYETPMDQGFTEREESVAKVADKARRKVAKAKQSADKEVERAAKKVAKEEERETKKRQKEFEKRRSQFVTGISKNLGAAVNTYLAGGTLTFREHGRDLASTVFKGLGVV